MCSLWFGRDGTADNVRDFATVDCEAMAWQDCKLLVSPLPKPVKVRELSCDLGG